MMKRFAAILASLAVFAFTAAPGHSADAKKDAAKSAPAQVHKGQGTVKAVDDKNNKINVTHGPIPSLNWPAMTMDLQVKDKALLKGLKPGQNVDFDIVQEGPGQFIITRIAPAAGKPAPAAPAGADAHKH